MIEVVPFISNVYCTRCKIITPHEIHIREYKEMSTTHHQCTQCEKITFQTKENPSL